jgi:hypothetical protein
MNKLKLHLEDLSVETFDTSAVEKENGTVVGEQCSCNGTCPLTVCATCPQTCDDYSCAESCGGTCPGQGFTCNESCGGTCFQSRCVDTCLCY